MFYKLLNICQNRMETVMSKSWGYRAINSTFFDGLVGALQKREVDFGTSLFFKPERLPYVDYARRVTSLRNAILFRNPRQITSFYKLVETLSTSVWILTITVTFFVVIQLKLALKLECNVLNDVKELCENTWSSLTLLAIGSLCLQGWPKVPYLYCGRIVILTVLLLSILVNQFYSGTIVSHLLTRPSSRIRTINDLISSDMKLGCEDILYTRDFFRQTTDPQIKKLYRTKMVNKKNKTNYLQPEEGLGRVSKGNFAYHVELSTAYEIIEKTFSESHICELNQIEMLNYQYMYMTVQKQSPFRKMINFCINKMAEAGLLNHGFHFWQSRRPICVEQTYKATPVGLNEFYPVLQLFAMGLCVSLTVLIFEIIINRQVSRQHKNVKTFKTDTKR